MYTIETSLNVAGVAFSADGRLAVESAEEWCCEVWPLPPHPKKVWYDVDAEDEYGSFGGVFDPRTGALMHAHTGGAITITRRINRKPVSELLVLPAGPTRTFAVSPSGDRLVCGCEFWWRRRNQRAIPAQLVSFTRGPKQPQWKRPAVFETDGFGVSDVAFFQNGKRLASVGWSKQKRGQDYTAGVPTLRIHDAKTLNELDATTFKMSAWTPRLPANKLVVCGDTVLVRGEKSFRVWDGDDLAIKPTEVKTGKTALVAIVADPQGRFILTATGNAVSVWDANSWSVSKTYEWNAGKITCLAVSPDGLLAAAGTATGKVVVWDTE